MELTLPARVARRYVLGKQGLWPGRRWSGEEGLRAAMLAVANLQLDPLNITARSQDLMLHARVAGYEPEAWQGPAYGKREFFDWGSWLAVRPMAELPYFRRLMEREAAHPHHSAWAREHAGLLREMREVLSDGGPVTNRDFDMASRRRVNSYRGRKDSAVALYHLWRTGEVMIHGRERFERRYDLTSRIAPAHALRVATDAETDRFLVLKNVAFFGLYDGSASPAPNAKGAREHLRALAGEGELVEVGVEGQRRSSFVLASDVPLLEVLLAGGVPAGWEPLATSTTEEVSFLAPLDPVSARGRAAKLFGFDYVWEVYKPLHERKWGYYVLPILWGDELVARADMRLDREAGALEVLGFWLEERETGGDPEFVAALARGLRSLREFVGARRVDLAGVRPVVFRRAVAAELRALGR